MNDKAAIFHRFADQITDAARARARELGLEWSRTLQFATDFLMLERCAVAAIGAAQLTDEEAEATRRFLELEIAMTEGGIKDAKTADDLADAVMCGSDGMHSFLLAHDLIDRYLDWSDASNEWLDVLTYGHDAWQTVRGIEARESRRQEREARRRQEPEVEAVKTE